MKAPVSVRQAKSRSASVTPRNVVISGVRAPAPMLSRGSAGAREVQDATAAARRLETWISTSTSPAAAITAPTTGTAP